MQTTESPQITLGRFLRTIWEHPCTAARLKEWQISRYQEVLLATYADGVLPPGTTICCRYCGKEIF